MKNVDTFRRQLLDWYRREKRTLPWRDIDNPYAVLVSEVMLQQTQVATVIPYFERFLARFPTPAALADAPMDDVYRQWQGLGYYSRARNLQEAARDIVERFDGCVPDDVDDLLSLPGVGRYTAGAVASIAYRKPAPIVDGNVMRVLTRLYRVEGNPKAGKANSRLWEIAESLVPQGEPHNFNVGLMELGALICVPNKPACGDCPVSEHCEARRHNEVSRFPELPKRRETVAVEHVAVMIQRDGAFLLVKRPKGGRWAGMWELPRVERIDGEALTEAAARAGVQVCGVESTVRDSFGSLRHSVTRYRIHLHGFRAEWSAGEPQTVECDAAEWVTEDALNDYPLSSPQRRLLGLGFDRSAQERLFT